MHNHQTEVHATHQISEPLNANQMAEVRTDLATERTILAADRSLMAWVRTGLSMISFGITIYKVIEGFQERSGIVNPEGLNPKNVGLVLIGMGSLSIITGTIEYWHRLGGLVHSQKINRITPAFVMAIIWSVIGVAAFISVAARLL